MRSMSRRWIATVVAVLGTAALPAGAADADSEATFAPVAASRT